jgi:hypothetical protein
MKKVYLKWWLLNTAVLVSCSFAFYLGIFKEAYEKDSSYLCLVIFALYIIFAFYSGWIAHNIDSKKNITEKHLDPIWFVSELCLSLGMIGTVIGFISMLKGFNDVGDGIRSVQKMMANMSYGMATALYTTLAGLIFGNLLKLQAFQIEKNLQDK